MISNKPLFDSIIKYRSTQLTHQQRMDIIEANYRDLVERLQMIEKNGNFQSPFYTIKPVTETKLDEVVVDYVKPSPKIFDASKERKIQLLDSELNPVDNNFHMITVDIIPPLVLPVQAESTAPSQVKRMPQLHIIKRYSDPKRSI